MTDSAGWTDAQIFATVGGIFGLIFLIIVGIVIAVLRQKANRTAAVKTWASTRGLIFQDGAADAPDLSTTLGKVKVVWQIRGSLNGAPIVILDTTSWVGRNVGVVGRQGQISKTSETFAFFTLPKPLSKFEARSTGGMDQGGATPLAMARRLGIETRVAGHEVVAFDAAPDVQVHAVDAVQTRALLAGPPIAALAARPGWRIRAGGTALLVSWCPDLVMPDECAIEAMRMDEFVAGAQALAATIRRAVVAS